MKKEIELKYLFRDQQDFDQFEHFLAPYVSGHKHYLRQENFYFDTPKLNLRKNGISLRLRKQNDEYLLSAKQSLAKKKSKKNLSVRLEFEKPLLTNVALLLRDPLLSPLDAFFHLPTKNSEDELTKNLLHQHMKKASKQGLQIIGSFVNHRTLVPIKFSEKEFLLEFDHSIYPKSIEFFEVEVEFSSVKAVNSSRPILEMLFHAANIKTQQSSSKSSRLYKILFT